jgi:hypothetical protein
MGRHSQKFRELLENVPKPTDKDGFTPELASIIITTMLQKALYVIAELEENVDDLEQEVTKLQTQLIQAAPEGKEQEWLGRAKYEKEASKRETSEMLDKLLGKKGKQNE